MRRSRPRPPPGPPWRRSAGRSAWRPRRWAGSVRRRGPAGAVMSRVGPEPGERLDASARRRAGTGRVPGSVLIAVAAWLLALIGGGALFVSFSAQYTYILAVRRQDAASVIEALLLDLLMIVFTLLALGLSRAGESARAERVLILLCAARRFVHERVRRRLGQPPVGRRLRGRPGRAGRGGGPGCDGHPPPRPGLRGTLGLENRGPRPGGRGQDRRAGVVCTACGSSWPAPRPPGACAGWCWTPLPCQHSPKRPRLGRSNRLVLRKPSCSPCTAPTQTTETAAQPAGLPPSWPRRPDCNRAPPAATCTPNWTAGHHDCGPANADPSPRALGESLAALAAQVAELRGQVRALHERLDQAGLHADLNLAARFEELAQTVADALDTAAPRGPAAPCWIGLDRDTYHAQLADFCAGGPTPSRPHYGGYELREAPASPHPRHLGTIHPGRRVAPHLRRDTPRNPARALEFYDRWLPGTMRRITDITRTCMPQCVMLRGPGDWAARPGYR